MEINENQKKFLQTYLKKVVINDTCNPIDDIEQEIIYLNEYYNIQVYIKIDTITNKSNENEKN